MATAHINIGSNIGDRLALTGQAVAAVESALGAAATVSEPFESEPWGFESANGFINVGLNIDTGSLDPASLMRLLQEVERSIDGSSHRNADGSYRDRLIDIDLIAVDTLVIDTPELVLPHPRMHLREFVLRPMCEVWPGWRHPLLGLTPAEMAALAARQQRF